MVRREQRCNRLKEPPKEKKAVPPPLVQTCAFHAKIRDFFLIKIANRLHTKEINFFIFFADSRIVQARFVLSGHSPSRIIGVWLLFFLHLFPTSIRRLFYLFIALARLIVWPLRGFSSLFASPAFTFFTKLVRGLVLGWG